MGQDVITLDDEPVCPRVVLVDQLANSGPDRLTLGELAIGDLPGRLFIEVLEVVPVVPGEQVVVAGSRSNRSHHRSDLVGGDPWQTEVFRKRQSNRRFSGGRHAAYQDDLLAHPWNVRIRPARSAWRLRGGVRCAHAPVSRVPTRPLCRARPTPRRWRSDDPRSNAEGEATPKGLPPLVTSGGIAQVCTRGRVRGERAPRPSARSRPPRAGFQALNHGPPVPPAGGPWA